MSKKKWFLIVLVATLATATFLYYFNIVPQFTSLVDYGIAQLQDGFNANPLGIVSATGAAITTVATGAKLLWNRTRTSLEGTYNLAVAERDRQITSISDAYNSLLSEKTALETQVTTLQTRYEATSATLTQTQKQLADATTQIQRKQDEYNAITNVKAAELRMEKTEVAVQDIIKAGSAQAPAQIKQAIESKPFLKATVQ
jgi:DNA-binding protein H-NS